MVCGPVVAEILAGARSDQRAELGALLNSLPWAELGRQEWLEVGELAARLRHQGATVPLTDLEIAVAASAGQTQLWTWDTDFDLVMPLLPDLRYFQPT